MYVPEDLWCRNRGEFGSFQQAMPPRVNGTEVLRQTKNRHFVARRFKGNIGVLAFALRVLEGVPYRRFRRWKRLMLSFELLHAKDNMTFAAVDSGFADATHFSHAFRDTFGVNPAPVFATFSASIG